MKILIGALILAGTVSSSVSAKEVLPVLSALEIQQIQSREFDADFNNVFASLITTLQDNAYTITTSDRSAGIISATAASKSKITYNIFWGVGSKKRSQVVTAFVEPRGVDRARLRLTIVDGEVKKNLYGGTRGDNDSANIDPSVYKAVFEKIEQVIFLRKALDASSASSPPPSATVPLASSVPVAALTTVSAPAPVQMSTTSGITTVSTTPKN